MNFGLAFATGKIPGVNVNLLSLNQNHEPESAEAALNIKGSARKAAYNKVLSNGEQTNNLKKLNTAQTYYMSDQASNKRRETAKEFFKIFQIVDLNKINTTNFTKPIQKIISNETSRKWTQNLADIKTTIDADTNLNEEEKNVLYSKIVADRERSVLGITEEQTQRVSGYKKTPVNFTLTKAVDTLPVVESNYAVFNPNNFLYENPISYNPNPNYEEGPAPAPRRSLKSRNYEPVNYNYYGDYSGSLPEHNYEPINYINSFVKSLGPQGRPGNYKNIASNLSHINSEDPAYTAPNITTNPGSKSVESLYATALPNQYGDSNLMSGSSRTSTKYKVLSKKNKITNLTNISKLNKFIKKKFVKKTKKHFIKAKK